MNIDEAYNKLGVHPSTIKPQQQEIVDGLLNKENVFGILPTGFGKSLCFQAPALATEGTTLVFSPLISLMNDQVTFLKTIGVAAEQWNSTISVSEKKRIRAAFESGELDLLYMAPEALGSKSWSDDIKYPFINYMVIDEAHCLSQWGHDFRPDYLRLYKMIEYIQPMGLFACSATIDPYDYKIITKQLHFNKVVRGEMTRPNLQYLIRNFGDKFPDQNITSDIRSGRYKTPMLIFCQTIKHVETLYDKLNRMYPGLVGYYHGQCEGDHRHETQDKFINNKLSFMVATNAFGMGVNKPDIRTIIHADLPISLTHYVQEAGRAGRDGDPAACAIYYPFNSIHRIQFYFIECKNPSRDKIEKVYNILSRMGPYPIMTQNELASVSSMDKYSMPAIIAVLKKYQALETEATVKQNIDIRKRVSPDTEPYAMVYSMLKDGRQNLTSLAKTLDWEYKELRDFLSDMHDEGFIQYTPINKRATRATCFKLTGRGLDLVNWNELEEKRKQNYSRFNDMLEFSKSANKHKYIERYFSRIKSD